MDFSFFCFLDAANFAIRNVMGLFCPHGLSNPTYVVAGCFPSLTYGVLVKRKRYI